MVPWSRLVSKDDCSIVLPHAVSSVRWSEVMHVTTLKGCFGRSSSSFLSTSLLLVLCGLSPSVSCICATPAMCTRPQNFCICSYRCRSITFGCLSLYVHICRRVDRITTYVVFLPDFICHASQRSAKRELLCSARSIRPISRVSRYFPSLGARQKRIGNMFFLSVNSRRPNSSQPWWVGLSIPTYMRHR